MKTYFKNLPIQRKISFAIVLTSSTALAVASLAIILVQILSFRQSFTRDLRAIGTIIANNSTAAITFKDHRAAEEILSALSAKAYILFAQIEQPDGAAFASFTTGKLASPPPAPKTDGFHLAGDYVILREPVILAGERIATLHLVSDYRSECARSLHLYAMILGAVLILSVALAIAISNRLKRLISAPILDLARTAQSIARNQDYSLRAPRRSPDEVGRLTDAFNQMLTQIQSQDAALKRSGQQLDALVHSIDGIVWECAPDTFQFTFVSRQSERLLGYKAEQWLASPSFWQEKLHPEDAAKAIATCHEVVARRQPYHYEYRMLAADGRAVWIRESGVVLTDNDRPVAVRGIFQDVTEQKLAAEELAKLNRQLVDASRQAGMAEIATGVLHNVGNVLNSVNVSCTLVQERVTRSKLASLPKVAALLEAQNGRLGEFLTQDPKGRKIPGYFCSAAKVWMEEQTLALHELQSLRDKIDHIKEIVSMQQGYAKVSGFTESLSITQLVDQAIKLNTDSMARHGVRVERQFDPVPAVSTDKHKVLQILLNLIRNAQHACDEGGQEPKIVTLRVVSPDPGRVRVQITDNGVGIPPENLTRIFQHGFTTKKHGHGFGLHSGALAAKELGGALSTSSNGPGTGATFTLELPVVNHNDTKHAYTS